MAVRTVAYSFSLTELWSYETGDKVNALAFSDDGKLGVASQDGCAYLLSQDGGLLNKACGDSDMLDASYSNGVFGFVNYDGYAYLFRGLAYWRKVHVGDDHNSAITVLPDGFIACKWGCAYFDFSGHKEWDVDVGYVVNGPAVRKGLIYIADSWGKLHIISKIDGSEANEISYGEPPYDIAVCGNYLAVGAGRHLYLYNVRDPVYPRELWRVRGFDYAWNVAFSPDCEYIAVSDAYHRKLKIVDLEGNLVLERKYGTQVWGVAWWGDRIAVGLMNGKVRIYEVGT